MTDVVVSETSGNTVITAPSTTVISVSEINLKTHENLSGISLSNDAKITFDGSGGDTYLKYNSSNSRLELYVDGVIVGAWGA